MFRIRRFAFTSASLVLLAPYAVAAQYSFMNIADTRGPFESLDFTKWAVSDTGTVAFIGTQGGVMGTYVGDGASTINVVPDLSPPAGFRLALGRAEALNESGVAVATWQPNSAGLPFQVHLYEASRTQTIAEATSDAEFTRYVGGQDINDAGAVALSRHTFRNDSPGSSQQTSIARWVNGTSTTVLETTEGFQAVQNFVRLNERGDVAFYGWKHNEGSAGFYRTDGTTLTLIADSTGPLNIPPGSFPPSPLAVNDAGDVVFWSRLDAGGEGIFVGEGGPLTTVAIAGPTTPFSDLMWGDRIDINNQGTVAFFAELWDGRRGIFTGPDPANDKVVAHGDSLFGYIVRGLGRPVLNERGDIAFWYIVRDPFHPEGEWAGIALAVNETFLPGDYNRDGTVDAADYVVWRKIDGTESGYNAWRANFGQTAGSGAALPSANPLPATVPELSSFTLLLLASVGLFVLSRRRGAAKTGL